MLLGVFLVLHDFPVKTDDQILMSFWRDSKLLLYLFVKECFAHAPLEGLPDDLSICSIVQMLHHVNNFIHFHVIESYSNVAFPLQFLKDNDLLC